MLAEYKSKTVTFLVVGLVLKIVGNILAHAGFLGGLVGYPILALGALIFIMGCCFYAKAKGYAWWVGLLGLLTVIGLLVLYVLPDKHKS
jgi:hypothetical protein